MLALVRHPHAHSLASSLVCSHSGSLAHFFSHALARFLFASLLARFLSHFLFSLLARISFARFLSAFFPLNRPPILFIYAARLSGRRVPQAHPAPLAHRYHDNPCARKRAGLSARERNMCINVAEEKKGWASALAKEMCVNVSVVKKKASHKRGDLFFTLLNASHLKSH